MSHDRESVPAQAPINILLVDDEPKNLLVLEALLGNPDYHLVKADSADQALLALVSGDFALILLDIRMPGMTGFELAQLIKNRKKTAMIPIIFMTAYYNEDQHMLAGYSTGAVDYLVKPVNPDILRSKVATFTELHRKTRELEAANRALVAEINERSRAEAQLNELNETLERRVAERTEALLQSHTALRESETRFRRLFEASRDGVLVLDVATGRIVDANPFMTRLFGHSREYFLGKQLWEIGLFDGPASAEIAVRELHDTGFLRERRLGLCSKTGERIDLELVASVYREGTDSVYQYNIRDITQQVSMEKELHDQAAKVLELHRRKDEFLAMLSHELRSPIAPISNAVHLLGLHRHQENPIQEQARTIIERQLGRLRTLVDDLLEVSRITSGRLQLRREPALASELSRGAVETVRPLIEERGHKLTLSVPREQIWLEVDIARWEQVLVNLLTNAAKYTGDGGHIALEVETAGAPGGLGAGDSGEPLTQAARGSDASPAGWVRFHVKDTGVGISPALLPHVFDLFTQGDRSLDRSEGGLGIGLALVQRLTELHGGSVEARSVVGEGSEFIVSVPMGAALPLPVPEPSCPAATPNGRPLRVLVVDDNADTVRTLSLLLGHSGHEVRCAGDGHSALLAAVDFKPDAILLDIGLPGLTGYEVARRIRQQPALRDIALIAVSGYGQDADCRESERAGFDHHLVKPADPDVLRQILAEIPATGS